MWIKIWICRSWTAYTIPWSLSHFSIHLRQAYDRHHRTPSGDRSQKNGVFDNRVRADRLCCIRTRDERDFSIPAPTHSSTPSSLIQSGWSWQAWFRARRSRSQLVELSSRTLKWHANDLRNSDVSGVHRGNVCCLDFPWVDVVTRCCLTLFGVRWRWLW